MLRVCVCTCCACACGMLTVCMCACECVVILYVHTRPIKYNRPKPVCISPMITLYSQVVPKNDICDLKNLIPTQTCLHCTAVIQTCRPQLQHGLVEVPGFEHFSGAPSSVYRPRHNSYLSSIKHEVNTRERIN